MSIESVMPSNHLILCCPLLLLPSIFPSIRVFSNESAIRIRWPKYWSCSINPSRVFRHLGSMLAAQRASPIPRVLTHLGWVRLQCLPFRQAPLGDFDAQPRGRTSALGNVVPGRFFCFDGSDPKGVGRGRSEVCFEEKLSWLFYSKGNSSCSRKTAGGCLNCLSCWDGDRFLSACFGCLLVRYLGTGGPHKEDYGFQHQLVNKSYSPAGSLPS